MKAPQLIVVGTSGGGYGAVEELLRGLPADFPLPVAIAGQRPSESRDVEELPIGVEPPPQGAPLVERLRAASRLPLREVEDKDPVRGGMVHVAPADYHLLVEDDRFALSLDEHVCHARPSVDVLFESAAWARGRRLVAVVLGGASFDGARGAEQVKRHGGHLVVEEPASAGQRTMPEAALARSAVDRVLPLDEIAAYLLGLVR
ncbi:MAG TPA: chemotaxis protein CheB [Polyangiaceae bacterium]|nr:chemotaxis protein CheB [Polyangiaceae bacterium]